MGAYSDGHPSFRSPAVSMLPRVQTELMGARRTVHPSYGTSVFKSSSARIAASLPRKRLVRRE